MIFEVFGDILEDIWRTFEEFWRNWFVEEKKKIKNFRKVENEPFWWPQRPLQPQRSKLTSGLEFVAQILYETC